MAKIRTFLSFKKKPRVFDMSEFSETLQARASGPYLEICHGREKIAVNFRFYSRYNIFWIKPVIL
jgi:hypothetical protein